MQNNFFKSNVGGAGYRSRYLSHAKRALYHLSYAPIVAVTLWNQLLVLIDLKNIPLVVLHLILQVHEMKTGFVHYANWCKLLLSHQKLAYSIIFSGCIEYFPRRIIRSCKLPVFFHVNAITWCRITSCIYEK